MDYVTDLRGRVGTDPLILNGAVLFFLNEQDEVLLQQRLDGSWGLPGGLMELGESFEETAVREAKEETGLSVEVMSFITVCSGRDFFVTLKNGDQYYSVSALYHVTAYTGNLYNDQKESLQLAYFPLESLPDKMNDRWRHFLNIFSDYYKKNN